ncbi:hypothetical protein [Helicobacter sp. 23-1045]
MINTPPQTPPARGGAFSISPSLAEILHFLPLPCGGGQRGWVDLN